MKTWWRRLTRYEVITTRDDSIDYLARWRLLRTPWFCLYLHRFLAPDDACMHDHPWAFTSIVISGGYWEEWISGYWECGLVSERQALFGELIKSSPKRRRGVRWLAPGVRFEIGVDGLEVWQIRRRWRGLGSVAQHPADYVHRVGALHPSCPTYTLILRTRRTREWGFRTPTGWIPSHKYSSREHY